MKKLMCIFLITSITLLVCNKISQVNCQINTKDNEKLVINEQIHQTMYLDSPGEIFVEADAFPQKTIVQVNYTLLLYSNSSVFFYTTYSHAKVFSPFQENFTLAPGESFAETYTVLSGHSEGIAFLGWFTRVLTQNSNATVHFWYEVIKQGKISTIGSLFAFSTILIITIIAYRLKQKSQK